MEQPLFAAVSFDQCDLLLGASGEAQVGERLFVDWEDAAGRPVLGKNQLRRERVKITAENEKVEALNGLGVDINQLWYCDGRGRIYGAEKIPAGAKAGLEPKDMSISSPETDALRRVFSSSWLGGSDDITRQPQRYLRFNSYIAVLDGAPFVEQPLKNPKTRNLKSVVIGILNESADADKGG